MARRKTLGMLSVESGRATHLKVELYYSDGGMNYFTGKSELRGLYLAVTPVSRTECAGYSTETTTAFSGIKKCVAEMTRFNQKRLDEYAPAKDELDELINYVTSENEIVLKQREEGK